MGQSYNLFAGTVGHGLLASRDGGESWQFAMTGAAPPPPGGPLPFSEEMFVAGAEGTARVVALDPQNAKRLFAGTDEKGLYRSDDNGQTWPAVPSPMIEGQEIWSIAVDPRDSDTIFVARGQRCIARTTAGPPGRSSRSGSTRRIRCGRQG